MRHVREILRLGLDCGLSRLTVIGDLRRWPCPSARLFAAPSAQRLGRAANLTGDRGHRGHTPTGNPPMLINHPYRAVAKLRQNLFLLALSMVPAHRSEPPENPGRFNWQVCDGGP